MDDYLRFEKVHGEIELLVKFLIYGLKKNKGKVRNAVKRTSVIHTVNINYQTHTV